MTKILGDLSQPKAADGAKPASEQNDMLLNTMGASAATENSITAEEKAVGFGILRISQDTAAKKNNTAEEKTASFGVLPIRVNTAAKEKRTAGEKVEDVVFGMLPVSGDTAEKKKAEVSGTEYTGGRLFGDLVHNKKYVEHRALLRTRSPRLTRKPIAETIALEEAPKCTQTPQINWLSVLVTPAVSVCLMILLVAVMGISPVMLIMSGAMSVVSAVLTVINYRKQKSRAAQKNAAMEAAYDGYLNRVRIQLDEVHKAQLGGLRYSNPSPEDCVEMLNPKGTGRLWERRPIDDDFMSVRIGTGMIEAEVCASFSRPQVRYEENRLEDAAEKLAGQSRVIYDAPVICSLKSGRQLGVFGNREQIHSFIRNIITVLTATHSYDELKIIALIPEWEAARWSWLKWLPHCSNEARTASYIFTNLDEAKSVLADLEDILNLRMAGGDSSGSMDPDELIPHYLFLAARPGVEKNKSVHNCLVSGAGYGFSAVFAGERISDLPWKCQQLIELGEEESVIFSRQDSAGRMAFRQDNFTETQLDTFVRRMAPLYTDSEQATLVLPNSISFLEGYGVSVPEGLNIANRWERAKPYDTLAVPIAICADGTAFAFDAHSMHQGSHGLVAGATRSGKTEMVQTWLLSLAVNFSPADISFVLIDFKGTGMIAPFRGLPHLAGSITNLDIKHDAGIIDRNLISIRSELTRREHILDKYSELGIKNVNDLNKKYAMGIVPEKLPILFVVIDEYAEFRNAYPDFGREVDSIMATGAGLGVSMVLMTQSPGGVVSARSEANIKFRWCLRVANFSASREMLGRPDAAKLRNPGRAFIKIGEDELFEQVQSFWSGAPYHCAGLPEQNDFTPIAEVSATGIRRVCEDVPARLPSDQLEIDYVIRYITELCKSMDIARTQQVWCEPLPENISLDMLGQPGFDGKVWPKSGTLAPAFGLVDDPASQLQFTACLDFAQWGHTIIYGAPGTGKTTLLKTLLMSAASIRTPAELNIYIMDFGGWNMSVLRDLPHLGGIANDNDPDRVHKLELLLTELLDERKDKFSRIGVGNIEGYRKATGKTIPDILLAVDNFGPVLKLYPDLDAFFVNLTGSGANYGIYLVSTALTTSSVPMKVSSNIRSCIALQMVEKGDYTYLVGKVPGMLPAVPGRGYIKGNPPLIFQTAKPAPGGDDLAVTERIRSVSREMKHAWKGSLPRPIPQMPEQIPYGSVVCSGIALGLSVEKVRPVAYQAAQQHYLMISGTAKSGRTTMLQVIACQLREQYPGKLYAFSLSNSLCGLEPICERSITTAEKADALFAELIPELQRRQTEKQHNPAAIFENLIFAVDDFTEFFREISNETASRMRAVIRLGEGLNLFLIAAADAFALTALVNKGEALSAAFVRGEQSVLLGGCMNDHGGIVTKVPYSTKNTPVAAAEGFLVTGQTPVQFRMMNRKEK